MGLPFSKPPRSLCLLRLSAVGDISHALPVLRTLQHHWPQTALTWIIGKREHELVADVEGVEFIIFDKSKRWRAYAELREQLRGRRFDALLHMQMSLRASLISLLVDSDIKLGFDRARAKDMQWLFTNHKIPPHSRQHVIDSFFGFTEALGIAEHRVEWGLPVSEPARQFAEQELPGEQPTLLISPCASMAYRNWSAGRYAELARYAVEHHGMRVVLCGGPSMLERSYGEQIEALCGVQVLNLIGKSDLKQLLALLQRSDVCVAPDSGPAHLAAALGTPVIGLYAATNPFRAGPYRYPGYVVSHYDEAVRDKFGKTVVELPWGIRVRDEGTMERIQVEEVNAMLDRVLMQQGRLSDG